MTLYLISGLGADERVFEKLKFPNTHKVVFLNWILPTENERINHYALRLAEKINTSEPFSIIGLSFGGMIATEISKVLKPEKTILISTISTQFQKPAQFKIFRILPAYKWIPKSFLQINLPFVLNRMGVTNEAEKVLFTDMLAKTNIHFFRWAIKSILYWKQQDTVQNIYHIHGTSDLIFPIEYLKPDYVLDKGKHLMIYTRAVEVSNIITKILHP